MPTFTGRLSVFGSQSTLTTPATNFLLLKAGVSDPAQAQFAATFFLLNTKQLHSGQIINVVGNQGTVGTISGIAMTNASAVSPSPFDFAPTFAAKKSAKKAGKARKAGKKKPTKKAAKKASKK